MCTEPWSILQGIAPEEYKCANEFPFFYAKGSAVFMAVSLAEGNYVKPAFGFTSYFFITVTPFFGMLLAFFIPVAVVFGFL